MSSLVAFQAIRTIGTVLPGEALSRAIDLRMPGQTAHDYELTPGMTVNAAVARAWDAALGAHRAWKTALQRLPGNDAGTALTRDKWLLPLLYELGYGRPAALPAGVDLPPGLGEIQAAHYPVSHQLSWPADRPDSEAAVPLHLVGGGVALDSPTPGLTARAPQSMLQDYLNRSPSCLWGIVSNGHTVRLLRDASSLTKQSYVEFDLDDIFDNQRYSEFRLFFLTIHASRIMPIGPEVPVTRGTSDSEVLTEAASDENALDLTDDGAETSEVAALTPHSCWLEQWRTTAIADGTRALDALRDGVALALAHLGTGFVSHPGNGQLTAMLTASPDADKDLHRALLHIAYRLIVLFVAEDRELLHTASRDAQAEALYKAYYSTRRLRHLAATRTGTRHTDLWVAHLIVTDALAGDGLPTLALPGLAATLFDRDALGVLAEAILPNRSFLAAVRALAQIFDPKTGLSRPVDYRNLDSEELGSVYEGLLAYTPRYDSAARTFSLDLAAGNDRKKSGSYYTPSELIALVLDEALDPVIDDALRAPNREAALLAITVVDPAAGSGHFLVAAARRIATALATVRTGDNEPSPQILRIATADVIARCIYGVDVNSLAIEITKVALWLEAFDGSRPFPFLDAHLKVGNSLLGTTPALLRENIPDEAFTAVGGDNKIWASKLKARNKAERTRHTRQFTLFDGSLDVETLGLTMQARVLEDTPASTLAQIRARADAWRRLEEDPELEQRKLAADAWCAAFVQPKFPHEGQGITHDTVQQIVENPSNNVPAAVLATVREMAEKYRFFHWHLEFPGVFTVSEPDANQLGPGWQGGFSCVVGNPPWERVKIQDKEFFASVGRNDIADAKTAAIRNKMIIELGTETPPALHDMYQSAVRISEGTSHLLLHSGRYPLTGRGDVNTYSVFAETFRMVIAPGGAAGLVTPSGLATDATTAQFFADILRSRRLTAFYDFENESKIFAGVHNQFRFAVTVIAGTDRQTQNTRFAFYIRYLVDIPERRFELTAEEVLTLNPNTGTLPVFRTRADADITLGIYDRHPVLMRDEVVNGSPWGLSFARLFDMANDSGLFQDSHSHALADPAFNGWSYEGVTEYLPLYEAKMLSHFDHRFSTYRAATQKQLNKGTLPRLTDDQHDDPNMEPLARYWIARPKVIDALHGKWEQGWLLGWRDIARASDMRTFVPSVLPTGAVGHKFPVAFPADSAHGPLLHAVWSSMAFDYVARQKISGTGMTYFIVKQIACPTPDDFAGTSIWQPDRTLAEWVIPYVLELSYTSWRLQPYAQEMGDHGPPFRWDADRRSLLRADLEAAMLHVYGLTRVEAEHVLDSFRVVRKYEERDYGEYRTRRLVLEAYDRMTAATARGGNSWIPLAGLPAGGGPRHSPDRRSNAQGSH